ncbi:phage tail protein, partial [Escherichia coli]
ELMIGRAVVSVSKDGRQVQYSRATIGELRQYIKELESALGVSGRRRAPAGVGL